MDGLCNTAAACEVKLPSTAKLTLTARDVTVRKPGSSNLVQSASDLAATVVGPGSE